MMMWQATPIAGKVRTESPNPSHIYTVAAYSPATISQDGDVDRPVDTAGLGRQSRQNERSHSLHDAANDLLPGFRKSSIVCCR